MPPNMPRKSTRPVPRKLAAAPRNAWRRPVPTSSAPNCRPRYNAPLAACVSPRLRAAVEARASKRRSLNRLCKRRKTMGNGISVPHLLCLEIAAASTTAASTAKISASSEVSTTTTAAAKVSTRSCAKISASSKSTLVAEVPTGANPTAALILFACLALASFFTQFVTQKTTTSSPQTTCHPGIHTRSLLIARTIAGRIGLVILRRIWLAHRRRCAVTATEAPAHEDAAQENDSQDHQTDDTNGTEQAGKNTAPA